jgi:DNA-binding winged helix-turn-helix (wHTH) protein
MASPARSSCVIRFGAFELDAAEGQLRKGGVLLKLHPQPFQVLLLLAERPGQIVDRKEIRRRLWGDNTYVDFEGGINFCIKQVRAVLGDNADKPRYIETLPRRGYRFIAPVSYLDAASRDVFFAAVHPSSNLVEAAHANGGARLSFPQINLVPALAPTAIETRWGRPTLKTVAAALAVIAIVTAGGIFYLHRSPKLTEKDTVVLTDFVNSTGDDVLGDALRQALEPNSSSHLS